MVVNTNISGRNLNSNGDRNFKPITEEYSQSFETLRQKISYTPFEGRMLMIFRGALKNRLKLPVSKRLENSEKSDNPDYCPYHRILGYILEDCWVFKDLIEKSIRNGKITFPKDFCKISHLTNKQI
jgi:hypothetical protein